MNMKLNDAVERRYQNKRMFMTLLGGDSNISRLCLDVIQP